MNLRDIESLCMTCGKTAGGQLPEGMVHTVTRGHCPICGIDDFLIPVRDFGRTLTERGLLLAMATANTSELIEGRD